MLTMEPTACNIFRESIDKIYYLDFHEESACGELSIAQNGSVEVSEYSMNLLSSISSYGSWLHSHATFTIRRTRDRGGDDGGADDRVEHLLAVAVLMRKADTFKNEGSMGKRRQKINKVIL
jgi:hypothetical protein